MDKKRVLLIFVLLNFFYFGLSMVIEAKFVGPFTYIIIVLGLTELIYGFGRKKTAGLGYLDGSMTGAKYFVLALIYAFIRQMVNSIFGVLLPL